MSPKFDKRVTIGAAVLQLVGALSLLLPATGCLSPTFTRKQEIVSTSGYTRAPVLVGRGGLDPWGVRAGASGELMPIASGPVGAREDEGAQLVPSGEAGAWVALSMSNYFEMGAELGAYFPAEHAMQEPVRLGLDATHLLHGGVTMRTTIGRGSRVQFSNGTSFGFTQVAFSWRSTDTCLPGEVCDSQVEIETSRNNRDTGFYFAKWLELTGAVTDRIDLFGGVKVSLNPVMPTHKEASCISESLGCIPEPPELEVAVTGAVWLGLGAQLTDRLRGHVLVQPIAGAGGGDVYLVTRAGLEYAF
jgi:hypothetical protein